MEIEAHKDPDIWIWDQPIGTDIQYQHLKSAAACPFDNEDRSLLAKKNVVKRLRMAAKTRVNPKLLDRHGIKGFWTLVVYITFSRPWITIEEAIDHVIYVTQTWHENSASWINGWAYIGRPVVEDIIPFRQQIPQLLNELKASAEEWGWVTYIDKKILHGRTGLEEFMTAFNHDQDEMLEAFYVGLRALHMTTLREQSGPYVATSWRYFTTRHKLKLTMEEVRAGIPNDCPGDIHMISFTYDLDGFETFWRKAQNVDVARAAIWRAFQSEPALRDWLLIANYLDDDDSQDPPS